VSWTKVGEWALILVAVAVMVVCVLVFTDANILGPIAASFLVVMGSWLGVDMGRMLKETGSAPPGQFKSMHTPRYIASIVAFGLLFVLTYRVSLSKEVAMTATLSVFGSGSMLMIGMLVTGIEGNKLKT
jgi:hypothetical protein